MFLAALIVCALRYVSVAAVSCDEYDASKISVVTFDCFAAMMNLEDSLLRNVKQIVPYLSDGQVSQLVTSWINGYGSYGGKTFDESVTGQYPFLWVTATNLDKASHDMGLHFSSEEFDALVKCWGDLIPWDGTQETMEILAENNFTLAALSNGDTDTLTRAVSIFGLKFEYIFSSDFPDVGAFKTVPTIYTQTLAATGLTEYNILHIAGAPGDGWGARNAGFFSGLVYADPQDKDLKPCFLLKNITELPAILGIEQ